MKRAGWMVAGMLLGLLTSTGSAEGPAAAPVDCTWQNNCDSLDGWRFNAQDPGMCAKVETPEPSVVRIAQDGEGTWGKATLYITDVDIEKNPIVEVKANMCEVGSAWTLQVAPADWSEFITVIPRNSAHGTRDGNIWKAVKASKNANAWKGTTSFNLVVVIEGKGKASWFDHFCIRPKK